MSEPWEYYSAQLGLDVYFFSCPQCGADCMDGDFECLVCGDILHKNVDDED